MRRLVRLLACAILLAPSLAAQHPAAPHPAAAADSLLGRLVGRWTLRGQVQGDSVTYEMTGTRELGGRFVVLKMKDAAVPSQYEAHVYLGADSASAQLLVHWMDVFGAGWSVPHGIGRARGDTLLFTFAYASGNFRDTFTYDRRSDRWHFRLESADGAGGWKPFAEYHVRRR